MVYYANKKTSRTPKVEQFLLQNLENLERNLGASACT